MGLMTGFINSKNKKMKADEDNSKSSSTSPKRRWKIFRKLMRKGSPWRWNSGFKWRRLNLHISFVDDVLFKIVSVFEAFVLVLSLSFFFLCCGCHF